MQNWNVKYLDNKDREPFGSTVFIGYTIYSTR